MRGWHRQADAPRSAQAAPRLLVISDIHLGEDITVDGPAQLGEYIRALNRELVHFLDHYRGAATPARRRFFLRRPPPPPPPWNLVVDGDMFDFVKVSMAGAGSRHKPQLGTAVHTVRKLELILAVHRPLFRAMAAFLRAGHRVTIVDGNHDAEFFFPQVQARLRQELVQLAQHPEAGGARQTLRPAQQQALGQRLQFVGWFYAQAGLFHIEHGHQYDALCSFEYALAPDEPLREGTLATPLSHRPMPYLAEVLGDFSTHGVRQWSVGKLLRFVLRLGARTWWVLLRVYGALGVALLRQGGRRRQRAMAARAAAHAEALHRLAASGAGGYSLDVLTRLDLIKALPAEYSVPTMLHVFFFDRVGVGLGGALGALALWAGGRAGAAGALLTITALALLALGRVGRADISVTLRGAARQLAAATQARYVIFGHSHAPEFLRLGDQLGRNFWYINTGSWVTREILRGEAGTGMTYAELSGRGARLLRWRGKDRAPLCVQSDWQGDHGRL